MKTFKNYWLSPTPLRWKRFGDSILIIQAFLIGSIPTLPISSTKQVWILFSVGLVGTLGKLATNFATESITKPSTQDNG